MIKYRYIIGNQSIETIDLSSVPKGIRYETINEVVDVKEDMPIEIEPTKEELIKTIQSLEGQLNEVKQQLNNLL